MCIGYVFAFLLFYSIYKGSVIRIIIYSIAIVQCYGILYMQQSHWKRKKAFILIINNPTCFLNDAPNLETKENPIHNYDLHSTSKFDLTWFEVTIWPEGHKRVSLTWWGKLCVLLVEISVVASVIHAPSSLLEDVETKLGHSFVTWLWFCIFYQCWLPAYESKDVFAQLPCVGLDRDLKCFIIISSYLCSVVLTVHFIITALHFLWKAGALTQNQL